MDNQPKLTIAPKPPQPSTKAEELIYGIYTKLKLQCSLSLDLEHVYTIIVRCMKLISSENIFGWEKKTIATRVILLLIQEYGTPEVRAIFTEKMVSEVIEQIYLNSMHRYKAKGGCCIM